MRRIKYEQNNIYNNKYNYYVNHLIIFYFSSLDFFNNRELLVFLPIFCKLDSSINNWKSVGGIIIMKSFDRIKELEKGCGKEINPYKDIKFPCGEMAGGTIYYCNECELELSILKEIQSEVIKEINKWWNKITKERLGYEDKYYTLDKEDIKRLIKSLNGIV